MMLKSFERHSFRPRGIIPSFSFKLGAKIMTIEVEVVDTPLDYNILLGHSWTYEMTFFVYAIFFLIYFSHEGKIIAID